MRVGDYLIAQIGSEGVRNVKPYKIGFWGGLASSALLEPMMSLYQHTHEKRYLAFADYLVEGMTKAEDGPRLLDLALKGMTPAERETIGNRGPGYPDGGKKRPRAQNRLKAYEMLSCYQGLLDYAHETKRADVMEAVRTSLDLIIRDEITLVGGAASDEEWFHGASKQHLPYMRMQETCVTTTWLRILETFLSYTNEPKYADALEQSFYNAYLAAINRAGDTFAYYTPVNGYRYAGDQQCLRFENCCNSNGPRGFLAFMRALLQARDETVWMNFYVSGRQAIRVPATEQEAIFEVFTAYPKLGNIHITNLTEKKGAFTLALRMPAWMGPHTTVKVNGEEVKNLQSGTYLKLARTWTIGDCVEIDFEMPVRLHTLPHAVAFTRGPIALARDSRYQDGALDEPVVYKSLKQETLPAFTLTKSPSDDIWMTLTAPLPIGSHSDNPHEGANPSLVHFCDYASAANLWEIGNACRVWLPEELSPRE